MQTPINGCHRERTVRSVALVSRHDPFCRMQEGQYLLVAENFSSFHYILVVRIVDETSEYDCTILTLGSERSLSEKQCTKRELYHR